MSLCFRTLPNKLTSFVNTRKQVTKIDRQLPKHIKSSSFLEEFFGPPIKGVTKSNSQEGVSNSSIYPLPNLSLITVNTCNESSELPNKSYDPSKEQIQSWPLRYRPTNAKRLGITNTNIKNGLGTNDTAFHNNVRLQVLYMKNHGPSKNDANESVLYDTERLSVNNILHNPVTSNFNEQKVLLAEQMPDVKESVEKQSENPSGGSSDEKLQHVFNVLSEDLPRLFVKQLNYHIYTTDIIFVNNIRGVTTTGMMGYVKQLALLKVVGHIRFAYVKLDVLKMTMHPEDNTIKVRWRIKGISGMKVLLMFWKYKLWQLKESISNAESWYDGFSTFYVNTDGKVFKHVADKMMPDQDDLFEKATKTPIAAKLTLFTPLMGLDMYSWTKLCSRLSSQMQMSKIK